MLIKNARNETEPLTCGRDIHVRDDNTNPQFAYPQNFDLLPLISHSVSIIIKIPFQYSNYHHHRRVLTNEIFHKFQVVVALH
jgi:hypothetical protein